MKTTYKIEIGNKVLINKIGAFLGIVGSLLTILFGLILFSSILMPSEMTMIFLIEFIEREIYVVLPISILMLIIGIKIAKIRNYKPAEITIESDKISFSKSGELIVIPEPRLHKIIKGRKFLSKVNRITIKTDTHKEYDIKGTDNVLKHLSELFPNKTELKNVGQQRV